ncbi:MAG: high-potential iron-sulfur protein [Burkholderiales bacterium]|nr:high-potential iron-sulfur protein [Burkholderiales bacterium]
MQTTRRRFIRIVPAAGAALLAGGARAAMVDEASPQARALGYVADAARADKSRFKQYAAGQRCTVCALWQGRPGDAVAACPLFPGTQVDARGWCSAFAKRPAS